MENKNDSLPYDEDRLRAYLEKGRLEVDTLLDKSLSGKETVFVEAMRYSLFAGGKRFRPNLCLAATESVWDEMETSAIVRKMALPFACALELIHTYSLVHDDLPAMDNDDLRRGKPTNHKQYGEGTAILVGDALLTEAFRLMTDLKNSSVSPQQALEATYEMASGSGINGMVLGQFMDLQAEHRDEMDIYDLMAIHRHKTGALIAASARVGGIVGGASQDQLERLTRYGQDIGLAFQIMDDLLDVFGEASELGKSVGQDRKKEKWTYPRLVGPDEARHQAHQLAASAVKALDSFGLAADPLRWIAGYTIQRRN